MSVKSQFQIAGNRIM